MNRTTVVKTGRSGSVRRLVVGTNAVICQETSLLGDITIGRQGCVLHPKATIYAETAPIIIGKNNIFEENVVIINNLPTPLFIGDDNLFETGSRIESCKIGNQNVFEIKSRVKTSTIVGNNCIVGVNCETTAGEQIPDGTVIYGNQQRRMQLGRDTAQVLLHARHLEYLRDIIPKYNHLRPLH